MGIGPRTVAVSGGSDKWMGSRHAVAEAHPGTLNATAFASATGVTDSVVPSGYPLTKTGDLYGPYDGATLDGFNIGERSVADGDETTAVMWHGRIKVEHLPVTLTAPTAPHAFVFVGDLEDGE